MDYPRLVLALFLASSALASVHAADSPPELAKQVQGILKTHCFKCHGEGGANEGGFNFVLNRQRLLGKFVVAGQPDKSLLLKKISSGEMPQDADPLKQADQDTIRKWIASGAPDFDPPPARKFIAA